VWADRPVSVYGPGINVFYDNRDHWYGFPTINAGPRPTFAATKVRLSKHKGNMQVWLRATTPQGENATVCFTGVVLAQGSNSSTFTDASSAQGLLGKRVKFNAVRNPYFLLSWPDLAPWTDFLQRQNYFSINSSTFPSIVSTFLDSSSRWYPINSITYLLRSFWDTYSWGGGRLVNIPGIIDHPYRILGVLMILCSVSFIFYLTHRRNVLPWAALLLLAMLTLAVYGIAYVYGVLTMGGALRFRAYYPSARFIYPVILPISFVLCAGWLGITEKLPRIKKHPHLACLVLAGFLLAFAVYAWYSLVNRFGLGL